MTGRNTVRTTAMRCEPTQRRPRLVMAFAISMLVIIVGVLGWPRLEEDLRLRLDRLAVAVELVLRQWCGIPAGFPR